MKFIRTENNIFEVVGENELVYRVRAKNNPENIYSKSKCRTDVVKQADTIEELCDLFVIKGRTFHVVLEKTALGTLLKNYETEPDIIILGAIWASKGLIYVAKMKGISHNGEIDWKLL